MAEVSVIKKMSDLEFIIQCGYCRGVGREPRSVSAWKVTDYYNQPCTICDGKGVLRIQVTDMLVPDAYCKGTGLKYEYSNTKCEKCNGLGVRSLTGQLKIIR